jgi:uncharacterized protein
MLFHALRVLFFVGVCLFGISGHVAAQDRFALVIGNQAYQHLTPLKNPEADAKLVSQSLTDIGFEVDYVANATKAGFEAELLNFSRKITPGAIIILYYAGHGVQSKGENFLLPVDADIRKSDDLPLATISANQMLDLFRTSQAEATILVLDACRNNPLELNDTLTRDAGGATRGLALVSGDQIGTLLAFSTSPGEASFDGAGANSPYSLALSAILKEPGLSIEEVFKNTRAQVVAATDGQQVPWENSSLTSSIILNPEADQPPVTVATACDLAAAHPSDPDRVGPSVEFANLDPQRAIPACEQAVADFPDEVRFKTLLARALDKAGRGEEAAALNEAAMQSGSLAAYHNMGNLYRKGLGVPQDLRKAFELYKYAAERGHPEDQSNVGVMYLNGDGVEQDLEQARYWLQQAAAQNWADAINRLGLMTLKGQAGNEDATEAFELFERSANLGSRNGMVNLANAYRKGQGVAEDKARALDLYENSARLGTRAAFVVLGSMYRSGEAGTTDPVKAAFWYTLASREGDAESMQALEEIKATLSAEQIQELDKLIEDWDTHRFG